MRKCAGALTQAVRVAGRQPLPMKRLILIALLGWTGLKAASNPDRLPGPVFEELGTLRFPVTTRSAQAQRYLDQGMAFLWGCRRACGSRTDRNPPSWCVSNLKRLGDDRMWC